MKWFLDTLYVARRNFSASLKCPFIFPQQSEINPRVSSFVQESSLATFLWHNMERQGRENKVPSTLQSCVLRDFEDIFEVTVSGEIKDRISSRKCSFFSHLFLDYWLCIWVFGPAVIIFWRGIWDWTVLKHEEFYEVCDKNTLSVSN